MIGGLEMDLELDNPDEIADLITGGEIPQDVAIAVSNCVIASAIYHLAYRIHKLDESGISVFMGSEFETLADAISGKKGE
jgi:hypothetical protein